MQIKATVHSAAPVKIPTPVTDADGNKLTADVAMLAVELVTDGGDGQKNATFNMPMDYADAFKPGARVTITIAPEVSSK